MSASPKNILFHHHRHLPLRGTGRDCLYTAAADQAVAVTHAATVDYQL